MRDTVVADGNRQMKHCCSRPETVCVLLRFLSHRLSIRALPTCCNFGRISRLQQSTVGPNRLQSGQNDASFAHTESGGCTHQKHLHDTQDQPHNKHPALTAAAGPSAGDVGQQGHPGADPLGPWLLRLEPGREDVAAQPRGRVGSARAANIGIATGGEFM